MRRKPSSRPPLPRTAGQRGLALLALLLVIALMGIALMAAVDVWQVTRQRERETELLFVGNQYRQAIRSYYLAGPPNGGRAFPQALSDLLDDDRFPVPVHHLRRLYADPVNPGSDWGLQMAGDRIIGVYSQSEATPLKNFDFDPRDRQFVDATSYQGWVFAYVPPIGRYRVPSPGTASPGGSPLPSTTTIGNPQ
jgi:type II secretory pathway pseudopilin PulG